MVSFPNCKINLGLHIIRKRSDGFHDIETVFYPFALTDALEILPSENNRVEFSSSGIDIGEEKDKNLCLQAYDVMKKKFPQLPPIKIHLHKSIPVGAGLGGGSSDAAFMIKMLNKRFQLEASRQSLIEIASQLGSDCPFFIYNETCMGSGRGEILQPVQLDLSNYKIVIVYPGIHISSSWAYAECKPASPAKSLSEIIKQPVEKWRSQLKNDFEEIVFKKYSKVKELKEKIYKAGAIYSSMSGSGSTVYGIFEKNAQIEIDLPADYFVKISDRQL